MHPVELTNMKMSKKETIASSMPEKYEEPSYPYGLEIDLGNETLDKLGIKELPEVGEMVEVHANAKVVRVSATDSQGGGKHKNVCLQIEDLALVMPEEETEDTLYGSKSEE